MKGTPIFLIEAREVQRVCRGGERETLFGKRRGGPTAQARPVRKDQQVTHTHRQRTPRHTHINKERRGRY